MNNLFYFFSIISKTKESVFYCLVLSFILSLSGCFNNNEVEEKQRSLSAPPLNSKKYEVTYKHKGEKSDKAINNTLYQLSTDSVVSEETLKQARYFMDVVSVFCGENVCKVDKVRLYWDELGFYHHIELAKGVELEKGDGFDFEVKDYVKLDTVLSNQASGLKVLEKHELVSNQNGGNAVDALTGATVSILQDDYITGAIWTCYTLWHFANGDMQTIIRNITGDNYSVAQLKNYLLANNSRVTRSASSKFNYQKFAIEQLTRRRINDSKTQDLVITIALDDAIDIMQPLYIGYVEQLSTEHYFSAISRFISSKNNKLRWLALKSLEANNDDAPLDYYLTLSQYLSVFDFYQQIHVFLTLLKNKQAFNEAVNEQLITLLNHENFIIARAVFWTLNEQKVSVNLQQYLNDFEQKYSHKL